jgi:hypothetical protein
MRETRVAFAAESDQAAWGADPTIIEDLREGFLSAPAEDLVCRHVAAMLVVHEATRFLARDARRRRRRVALAGSVGVGAVLLVGGAAAAEVLPTPVQEVVADLADPFGVDVHPARSHDAPPDHEDGPGRSESAPGQLNRPPGDGDAPGQSEDAPGHGGTAPGRSGTAPGHSGAENNRPDSRPGLEGEQPVPPGLQDGTGRPPEPGVQGQSQTGNGQANGQANGQSNGGGPSTLPNRPTGGQGNNK